MILNFINYIWIGIGSGCSDLSTQAIGVPFPFFNRNLITIAMNQEKKCTKCGIPKPLSEFSTRSDRSSGYKSSCKECAALVRSKYLRTRIGIISGIFDAQRSSSKTRGHNPPGYTKQQLIGWCMSQDIFHTLYFEWVKSGYDKMLKPSCDRTDDSMGYSLDRLQIMTWRENASKSHEDHKNGILIAGEPHRAVIGTHIISCERVEYVSIGDAGRKANTSAGNISSCCNGIRKQAGGYQWQFNQK